MPAGIRTPDTRLRRAMLYPAELLAQVILWCAINQILLLHLIPTTTHTASSFHDEAGRGNRTPVTSLEGWSFTIKLHPQNDNYHLH
ncbi:protein of unknown function [Petrocella atlantisensis]|uniref:Uncharacterized protein n=1 Tax=Petrocella atlantisensis TaxID=2173034 RepID=A0A3P7PEP2_9FIRM|nr:protein of unknown function [Petrocella atlantisensis]